MADPQFGGAIRVYLDPIFRHISDKLAADSHALKSMLESNEGLHDFTEQTRLMQNIQAGVRATDILAGSVNAEGVTLPLVVAKPPVATIVNMDALGKAIDPATMTTNQLTEVQKAA